MKNLVRGGLILSFGILVSKALGFLYIIPLYHIVGSEIGAITANIFIPFTVILLIAGLGIVSSMTKIAASTDDNSIIRYTQNANFLMLISSISAFLFLFFFSSWFADMLAGSDPNSTEAVDIGLKAISFTFLFVPLSSLYKGFLQGRGAFSIVSISNILEQVVKISIILFATYLFYLGVITNYIEFSIFSGFATAIAAIAVVILL